MNGLLNLKISYALWKRGNVMKSCNSTYASISASLMNSIFNVMLNRYFYSFKAIYMLHIYIKASKDLILPYGHTTIVFIYINPLLKSIRS